MTYQASFINPLVQFGKRTVELLLVDDAGVLPTIRQWRDFPAAITAQELVTAGQAAITAVLQEQADAAAAAAIAAAENEAAALLEQY